MKDKTITDYSISKKEFNLKYDSQLGLYQTLFNEWSELNSYYKSENYISHTDRKANWFEKIYQFVKTYTITDKWNLIRQYQTKQSLTVLDIGCGTGDFLKKGKQKGYQVVGVEPNEYARKLGQNKLLNIKSNLSEIKNMKFDVITMWHVLEHVPDYNQYLNEINERLNVNGILVIAVPNFKSFDAEFYGVHWAGWDVPRHLWHFSKKAISKIALLHKFKLIHIKPMYFDSFYVALLSEEYKHGSKNIIKAFIIGFWSNLKGIFTKEYSSHIYILKK